MCSKKIGFLALCSIIIGNCVGSGVLSLPSVMAKFGKIALWSYVISAIGMVAIGLMYSRMQMWLDCDGVHGPILKVFGHKSGQIAGFLYWISIVAGNSAMLITLFSYMGFSKISLFMCAVISIAIISLMTLFNCIDMTIIKFVEITIAALKILPLIGLPLFCVYYALKSNVDISTMYQGSFTSGIQGTLAHTLWAFLGIETAVVIGQQVRKAETTIPRAIIASMSLITLIYVLGMWTMLKLLPNLSNSNAPYADLLMFTLPHSIRSYAFPFVSGLAIFLILGSVYSWIFTTGVIVSSCVDQQLFPKFLGHKNKFGAPYRGLVVSSVLSILFLLFTYQESMKDHFNLMITLLTVVTFMIYLATNFAFFKTMIQNKKFTIYNILIGFLSLIACGTTIIILIANLII